MIGAYLILDGVLSLVQTIPEFEQNPVWFAVILLAGRVIRAGIGAYMIWRPDEFLKRVGR